MTTNEIRKIEKAALKAARKRAAKMTIRQLAASLRSRGIDLSCPALDAAIAEEERKAQQ